MNIRGVTIEQVLSQSGVEGSKNDVRNWIEHHKHAVVSVKAACGKWRAAGAFGVEREARRSAGQMCVRRGFHHMAVAIGADGVEMEAILGNAKDQAEAALNEGKSKEFTAVYYERAVASLGW